MVLPTGEVMGTGQMALEASERPYNWTTQFAVINRLFFCSQGTLGIAVKSVVTLTGELSQRLLHQEANDECFIANGLYLSNLLARNKEEVEELKKTIPLWTMVIGISGNDEAEVAYKELDIKEVLESHTLRAEEDLPGLQDAAARVMHEIDHPQGMLNQLRYKGACNYIACMASKTQINPFYDLTLRAAGGNGHGRVELGFMIMPLNFGGSYYFEPSLP
jgi:hypothetical protein